MKNTVFSMINKFYRLRIPSKKLLNDQSWKGMEQLALCFYRDLLPNKLKISVQSTIIHSFHIPNKSAREAYINLFCALPNKSQRVLDFIACIVSLLADAIITAESIRNNTQSQNLLETLELRTQKMRQFILIEYTQITLGISIRKESAIMLFNNVILDEFSQTKNLNYDTKLKIQMKQVSKIFNDQINFINVRKRVRKIVKNNKVSEIYREEIQNIFMQNQMDLEHEKLQTKKFNQYLENCFNDGSLEYQPEILKTEGPVSVDQVLKSFYNVKENIDRTGKKTKYLLKSGHGKDFQHWQKVLGSMKSSANTSLVSFSMITDCPVLNFNDQRSVQPSQKLKSNFRHQPIAKDTIIKRKGVQKLMINLKSKVKYNRMLPQIQTIKVRKNFTESSVEKRNERITVGARLNALKLQYRQFLTDQSQKSLFSDNSFYYIVKN